MEVGLPWTEKYRPQKLSEVAGQKDATEILESYVKNKNVSNLLFSGPPGSGKTSAAVALAKELFGKSFEQNFLELNASVVPKTPILVKQGKKIKRTNFANLAKEYFLEEDQTLAFPTNLQTLSVNLHNQVCFLPVSVISRHKVSKIAKIRFEGGEIQTSLNHSAIVLDSFGNLVAKECRDLKTGDVLLSFSEPIKGMQNQVDFEPFAPILANKLRSGLIKNPRVTVNLKQISIDNELAWLFGLYLAEGCAGLMPRGTSGYTIFTLGYPQEKSTAKKVCKIIENRFGVKPKTKLGRSGFDRSRKSSIQVQIYNTQLAKFFRKHFYDSLQKRKFARSKRVPEFVFTLPLNLKLEFLKGYMGDATGKWGKTVRYSSTSQENLIDIAWLARSCGLSCSLYNKELRIVWISSKSSYDWWELMSAKPFIEAFKREELQYTYFLRHSLYHKKCKRVSKKYLLKFFEHLPFEKKVRLGKLERILRSKLFAIQIKSIKIEPFNGLVYDFAVPGSEMFWGGTVPILLHNSDARGIDVVRGTIKEFARTLAFDTNFKIIFLDESDALTTDAQQALRRTMERYTKTCRFVLSCNYSSKLIEPIQSRCVVFRFRKLSAKDIEKKLSSIAEQEKLLIEKKALEAINYVADGDLRKAINILEATASLDKKISEKNVFVVSSRAKPGEMKEMIVLALKGDFLKARDKLDFLMYEYGMSGSDIITQMYRELIGFDEKKISSKTKIGLINEIGEYDFRLVEGANERIQIEALLAQFAKYK